jgi:hypothetical protein
LLFILFGNTFSDEGPGVLRFGGYGEFLYQYLDYSPDRYTAVDGAQPAKRSLIDIPRFNLMFEYNFIKSLTLTTEVEFEHLGTGSAMELEFDEGGEYEMEVEKGGEVTLEALYLTWRPFPPLSIHAGHQVVPIGRVNNAHMPTEYFTSSRPEGQSTLIPATWHETGLALEMQWKRLSASLFLVSGLDANGFSSANWIREGRQTMFEQVQMTNPALALRIDHSLDFANMTLTTAISGYTGKTAGNTMRPENMKGIDGRVNIGIAELELKHKVFIVRADLLRGHLYDSYKISSINKSVSRTLGIARTPVASDAFTWSAEAAIDAFSFFNFPQNLYIFGKYEYYNSMEDTEKGMLKDIRFERELITAGLNWIALRGLVIKADYTTRQIADGTLNDEHTFGISIAFSRLFFNKERTSL